MIEIKKIEECKSLFKIHLSDGSSHLLLPDIVYGKSLNEGRAYEESYLDSIIDENNEILCFNALLKILQNRMHSTAELRRKLFLKKYKPSVIDKAIKKAIESGVSSDEIAAECYKNELLAKGYGSLRIKAAFLRKGFSRDVIADAIPEDDKQSDSEKENARKIFDKKLSFLLKDKTLQKQKLKEKLFRFMQGKGYSGDIIFSLIKEFVE